jgi:UDPglucose--hexose-1-phosphate uridylyltransferase
MAERRYNPLTDDWVIVSPGRVARPWHGGTEPSVQVPAENWRADCHLCPRTTRASSVANPDYRGVYVFDNDFPALGDGAPADRGPSRLLVREAIGGRCRVLCYAHRHDATLGSLDEPDVRAVVTAWCEETAVLGREHAWVQVFENRGRLMGSSNDHPHGQIWASSHVPTLPTREDARQRLHSDVHGQPLLLDYAATELAAGERVVACNGSWLAVVPYWAAWPFEILLLPRRHCPAMEDLRDAECDALATILKTIIGAYDRLFGVTFPYSMGWHGRARGQGPHWQLHAHFYPPLLRSATVRKFMVGYEMLAEAQRDLTAEDAAARLRALIG